MNDTVYAVVQLNGADNISDAWGSGTVDLRLTSDLSVREPYFKREHNYMYMYVGVGSGQAVNLRVKDADNAVLAASVNCGSTSNYASIKTESSKPTLKISNTSKTIAMNAETLQGTNLPMITGFVMQLPSSNGITGHTDNSSTISRVKLSAISKIQLTNAVYGTAEPSGTADDGTLYFQISS